MALGWLWWRAWVPVCHFHCLCCFCCFWFMSSKCIGFIEGCRNCLWSCFDVLFLCFSTQAGTLSLNQLTGLFPTSLCGVLVFGFAVPPSSSRPPARPPPVDTQLPHTQLAHTQLVHTQLTHTQLVHTQLVTTQLAHTHNLSTHNLLTHTQLAHTHTTCPHTT